VLVTKGFFAHQLKVALLPLGKAADGLVVGTAEHGAGGVEVSLELRARLHRDFYTAPRLAAAARRPIEWGRSKTLGFRFGGAIA